MENEVKHIHIDEASPEEIAEMLSTINADVMMRAIPHLESVQIAAINAWCAEELWDRMHADCDVCQENKKNAH